MRVVLSALVLSLSFACVANAGPKEDALEVVHQWGKAFTAADVDGIVNLYTPDALFMGTSSKAVVNSTGAIRKYLSNALLNNRPRTAKLISHEAVVLSDTVVLINGLDTLTAVRDGKPTSVVGRVTFIVAKRGPDWKIVHFHRSRQP